MNAKYNFKVGDKVITTEGRTGIITDICTCDQCIERGFCEPIWKSDDGTISYITNRDNYIGFIGFHKIGDYVFHDFDKDEVMQRMAYHEIELVKLRRQLRVIEEMEKMKPKYKYCKKCRYFREGSCERTYSWVSELTGDCLGFEPDDLDW